jgi:hypothetical protein
MLAKTFNLLALALVAVAVALPTAAASSSKQLTRAQIARLGAQTEAAGFTAFTRYLGGHDMPAASRADLAGRTEAKGYLALQPQPQSGSADDLARLDARTEAAGFRAIARYEVASAEPQLVVATSRRFALRDAFVGAAVAASLLLLAAAGTIAIRRRTSRPLAAR